MSPCPRRSPPRHAPRRARGAAAPCGPAAAGAGGGPGGAGPRPAERLGGSGWRLTPPAQLGRATERAAGPGWPPPPRRDQRERHRRRAGPLVTGFGARSHPANARHLRQPPHPATRGSPVQRAWLGPRRSGVLPPPHPRRPARDCGARGCEGQSPSLSSAMAGNPAEPELAARPAALAVPLAALTRRRSPR